MIRGHWLTCIAIVIAAAGCVSSADYQDEPFVQRSAGGSARWTVDLNRVRDGIYRPYAPRCVDTVAVGHTVEFRNFLPDVAANVSSMDGAPSALYSPNLVKPYNYVGPDHPDNTLCDVVADDGSCAARPEWSFWRTTFNRPGVYDWLDTNQGEGGRQVVDPYYGTVTFIGIDPDTPFGTVCVVGDEEDCAGVCCAVDADCGGGTRCFRGEVDAVGRCLTPSG